MEHIEQFGIMQDMMQTSMAKNIELINTTLSV